ncbi:hypothetical protein BgAZ_305770 [Babesia gibsoni]|uniref:Uncharacterized protein n=1 Tax=Babesia gibsoni TaxID=33632 RepID=A0AAD8PDN5_BABGI|nr:hypothetical protein BgAZ_305770 [Babesia gibsoni]
MEGMSGDEETQKRQAAEDADLHIDFKRRANIRHVDFNWLNCVVSVLDEESNSAYTEEACRRLMEEEDDIMEFGATNSSLETRMVLSQMDVFLTDLGAISGLARKSNFCLMDYSEASWPYYKDFMYSHMRRIDKALLKQRREQTPQTDGSWGVGA